MILLKSDLISPPCPQITAITSAKGEKKVSALASAIRTMLFMQRYETELSQRDTKLRELQNRWWQQTMGQVGQARENEDRKQLVQYFSLLGWLGRGDEEESISDDRLNSLLNRACAYKKELDGWKEKNRDNLRSLGGPPQGLVNWEAHPWTSDGLWPLMEQQMERVQRNTEGAPMAAAVVKTPHADEGKIEVTATVIGGPLDYLTYTVKLLAGLRWDSLDKMRDATDSAKRLAVYRGIRTQKFIEFTERKIHEREAALREVRAAALA